MRAIVFFDLPNVYIRDKRAYLLFRKYLINEGFIMLQESVYSKLILNSEQSNSLYERVKRNAPSKGLIEFLVITERQYANIRFITGKEKSKIISSDERLVILWNLDLALLITK